uniref:Putative secreted peptide n=1 Tax=Anopheles braziliensis TaxID=58242 RepID=A0A2M3ZSX2_9DIPT
MGASLFALLVMSSAMSVMATAIVIAARRSGRRRRTLASIGTGLVRFAATKIDAYLAPIQHGTVQLPLRPTGIAGMLEVDERVSTRNVRFTVIDQLDVLHLSIAREQLHQCVLRRFGAHAENAQAPVFLVRGAQNTPHVRHAAVRDDRHRRGAALGRGVAGFAQERRYPASLPLPAPIFFGGVIERLVIG